LDERFARSGLLERKDIFHGDLEPSSTRFDISLDGRLGHSTAKKLDDAVDGGGGVGVLWQKGRNGF
jgi:hypothetical protein